MNWFTMTAASGDMPADVFVYDTICAEDVDAFARELRALGPCKQMNLRINSYGGEAFAAVAIFNTIAAHPANKTTYVDGIAASAASLIAMVGDKIVMPENTCMVVHHPMALMFGSAAAHRKIAGDLDTICNAFANTYARRSRQPIEAVVALMGEDRVMGAAECKAKGYCDEVTGAAELAATFDLGKVPAQHRAAVAAVFSPLAHVRRIDPTGVAQGRGGAGASDDVNRLAARGPNARRGRSVHDPNKGPDPQAQADYKAAQERIKSGGR
jgi:ATP-dependent protease ClpP protease subunit